MKRIIEGQTYNTDTSSIVALWEYDEGRGADTKATLYVTRGGAFFVVHRWETSEEYKYRFQALSRAEVARLVETTDNMEIVDDEAIGEPPEAAAEIEPGATLYVRVPASLKSRVDDAAKRDGVAVNAWAMRCMEQCLKPRASNIQAGFTFDEGSRTVGGAVEMPASVTGLAHRIVFRVPVPDGASHWEALADALEKTGRHILSLAEGHRPGQRPE